MSAHASLRAFLLPLAHCAIMTAMATAVTGAASAWAAGHWRGEETSLHRCRPAVPPGEEAPPEEGDGPGQAHMVTLAQALLFAVAAGAGLLAMWYFPNAFVYLSIASFVVGSACGTYYVTRTILRRVLGLSRTQKPAVLVAALLVSCWVASRNSDGYWPLQDLLSAALVALHLAVIRLPNLKVATALLSGACLYDVFFCFVTPLLTRNGESVMESAAIGTGITVTERMPMLLRLPVDGGAFAVLGLGDLIVPGLLMTLLREFDIRLWTGREGAEGKPILGGAVASDAADLQPPPSYHRTATVGYAAGIIFSFTVSVATGKGQPALMYVVPSVLFPVLCTARRRRDWRALWHGSCPTASATKV